MGFLVTPSLLDESDQRAQFDALAVKYWDRFYAFAYRHCGNTADAEDLLSESLLEAFQSFGAYQGYGFDRWMFRILTTNRIDQTRYAKRRPAVPLSEYTEPIAGGLNPQEQLVGPLFSEELQQALQKLPERFRVPLLLCELEGLDYACIASRLQVPIGTVRSRIHRARERLHQELRQFCHVKDCLICAKAARHRARGSRR
jgi:RNA polymerase sigma-70 factor, ECF subfamily